MAPVAPPATRPSHDIRTLGAAEGRVVAVCKLGDEINLDEWERKEGTPWWRPLGLAWATLVVAVAGVVAVPVFPLLGIFGIARWCWVRCGRWCREPAEVRVAIVGGGWSGLQVAARLQDLGVKNVVGFDNRDTFGGTWHPSLRYVEPCWTPLLPSAQSLTSSSHPSGTTTCRATPPCGVPPSGGSPTPQTSA